MPEEEAFVMSLNGCPRSRLAHWNAPAHTAHTSQVSRAPVPTTASSCPLLAARGRPRSLARISGAALPFRARGSVFLIVVNLGGRMSNLVGNLGAKLSGPVYKEQVCCQPAPPPPPAPRAPHPARPPRSPGWNPAGAQPIFCQLPAAPTHAFWCRRRSEVFRAVAVPLLCLHCSGRARLLPLLFRKQFGSQTGALVWCGERCAFSHCRLGDGFIRARMRPHTVRQRLHCVCRSQERA